SILPEKSWLELLGDTQHIMNHQHLSIHILTRTNAYHGNSNVFCHFFGQNCRDFLQHQREAPALLQNFGILNKLLSLGFLPCPYRVGAEFIDGLWREPQMAHYRHPGTEDPYDGFTDFRATFHLDRMG